MVILEQESRFLDLHVTVLVGLTDVLQFVAQSVDLLLVR